MVAYVNIYRYKTAEDEFGGFLNIITFTIPDFKLILV
jgi:hypothetical protein